MSAFEQHVELEHVDLAVAVPLRQL